MSWFLLVLKKYAVFSGRSRRKEYWYFALFYFLISVALTLMDINLGTVTETGIGLLSGVFTLALLLPSLAVTVRRLHDTDRSAWWLLVSLIPVIGAIVILVFMVLDSHPGSNRFGPNPKEA